MYYFSTNQKRFNYGFDFVPTGRGECQEIRCAKREEEVILYIPKYSTCHYRSDRTAVSEKSRINGHLCYLEPVIHKILLKLLRTT